MIEFTINRNRSGKKSRWAKKYPRKRILKRGSEKAAGWCSHNWLDDNYHHFHGDLHKFLLKNVGRPVDKVFSEFLQRCRKGTEKYNLKGLFYDMFKEKEDIDYRGGFYLSNGIINYKKRNKRPKGSSHAPSPFALQQLNTRSLPSKGKVNGEGREIFKDPKTDLSENYKEVYFTNSYKDWNKETLPDNVKVIEVV